MKTLLTRKTIIIASIAVLIVISTIISINVFSSIGPVTGLANIVSRPLRSLTSMVTRTFESIYASIYKYDDLMADYEKALKKLTDLESEKREREDIAAENERLRALLSFRKRHSGYESVDAYVDSRSGSNWSSTFIIKLGSANSDIQRGNAVVTEYGMLIGQVSEVGATTSVVATVLDTTFSAGAFIGDTDTPVTVRGDFTLMRSGLLMLDYIDENTIVLPGASIVTSGSAGVFPVGLVVGEVEEVFRHSTGVGWYATVKPMRDILTISQVFVITGFELTEQDQPLEQE